MHYLGNNLQFLPTLHSDQNNIHFPCMNFSMSYDFYYPNVLPNITVKD